MAKNKEMVNHPEYYNKHPSGIECIQIARHYDFNIGNAIKYLWRAGLKEEEGKSCDIKHIEDLKKAIWYINDEIAMLQGKIDKDSLINGIKEAEIVNEE